MIKLNRQAYISSFQMSTNQSNASERRKKKRTSESNGIFANRIPTYIIVSNFSRRHIKHTQNIFFYCFGAISEPLNCEFVIPFAFHYRFVHFRCRFVLWLCLPAEHSVICHTRTWSAGHRCISTCRHFILR